LKPRRFGRTPEALWLAVERPVRWATTMTLFEYLAIAFSLVLSTSAMRLIRGASHALAREHRYWVHAAFVVNQLGVPLGVFWALWSLQNVQWTFPAFVLARASPGFIYAAAFALVPENSSTVSSWRDHYFSNRANYFACILGWAIVTAASSSILLNMPWAHPGRAAQAFAFAFAAVGIATDRERVHQFLAVLLLAVLLVVAVTVLSQPGSLAP